ncbi:unnamed protein product [Somion occarium]|uniref:Cyanovirin-N domain-containing protein n=1 Tax=Somion occarium TaxID=3059160 RepID=A0ABP1D8F4_9APHY
MAFQLSSRYISLQGSVLMAECRTHNRSWKISRLDLNYYLGSVDGSFTIHGANFYAAAAYVELRGAFLIADLRKLDGRWNRAIFNLNLCVQNVDGELQFKKPNESIVPSTSCLMVEGPMLKALCMGYDGLAHATSINLNDYYENANGDFGAGRDFYFTARSISVQPSQTSILLKAELSGNHWWSGDFWNQSEIDLAICILNRGGSFIFEQHDGPFDRDGFFARFFERVPFVGFVIAGIQFLAGNEEHAKRALAFCANSSIVCCGIFVGALAGGPVGGAIGAGLMTPLGILVETEVAGYIKDPRLQAQFEEATVGRYLYETLRNTLAAGAAGYFGEWLGHQTGQLTTAAIGQIAGAFGGKASGISGEVVSYAMLKRLADALKNEVLPEEWLKAELTVKSLR